MLPPRRDTLSSCSLKPSQYHTYIIGDLCPKSKHFVKCVWSVLWVIGLKKSQSLFTPQANAQKTLTGVQHVWEISQTVVRQEMICSGCIDRRYFVNLRQDMHTHDFPCKYEVSHNRVEKSMGAMPRISAYRSIHNIHGTRIHPHQAMPAFAVRSKLSKRYVSSQQ